jgi:hypothetical protein
VVIFLAMLGETLKALEILLAKINTDHSPDKKREKIAKELLRVYLDVRSVVERGETILTHLSSSEIDLSRRIPITLLTLQTQALDDLRARLITGTIGNLLTLHLPVESRALLAAMDIKGNRVWFTLDQLVTDGAIVSPHEWVSRLESRMTEEDPLKSSGPTSSPSEIRRLLHRADAVHMSEIRASEYRYGPPTKPTLIIIATEEEISAGRQLLRRIADAGESIRTFLIDKFKLEDII